MNKSHVWFVGAGLVTSAVAVVAVLSRGAGASDPSEQVTAPAVVMLSGVPGEDSTRVVAVQAGVRVAWGTVSHVPGAAVSGAVLNDGKRAVVVADTVPAREPSWAASLLLVQKGQAVRTIADHVYHASSPLVLPSGHVLVQRGSAGHQVVPGTYRVDDLTVDEVDPNSGVIRTIHRWRGFETHLAGTLDGFVFLYRVGPKGADLVSVDVTTETVRVLVPSWPPFARDFSVDPVHRQVVAQQLATEDGSRRWVVERVDIATGQIHRVAYAQHRDMVPFAWPDGSVLYNTESRRFAVVQGAKFGLAPPRAGAIFWGRVVSKDRRWVGGLWKEPGALPEAVLVRASDGVVRRIPVGDNRSRVDVIGVVQGGDA